MSRTSRSIHLVVKGATNTKLQVTLLDRNHAAVALNSGDVVDAIARINGTPLTCRMTIVSAAAGTLEYTWTDGNHTTLLAGDHALNFKLTRVDGKIDYFPGVADGSLDGEIYDVLRVRSPI